MARKTDYIGILQAEPQCISYLRAERGGRGIRVAAHILERGAWSVEDGSLARALGAFVRAHDVAEDQVYTLIPRHEITCRILSLPTQREEEAASMVRLSADEYVPFSTEELIIDQAILRKTPGGESEVFAALAHRDVVQGHLRLFRECGIEPVQIFLSTACLATAVSVGHRGEEDRFAVLDLGASGFEVAILHGKTLQYTRGIAGQHAWSDAGEGASGALAELALELRSSLSAYRRESPDGQGVDHVYLSTELAAAVPLCEALSQETAKECAPAAFLEQLVEAGREKLEGIPLAALGAVLTARGEAKIEIALLPSDVERDRALVGAQARLKRGAVLVGLVLAGLLAVYFQSVYQRQQLIAELERERSTIAPQAEGVAQKQSQLQILRQQVDPKGTVLELLATIAKAAPEKAVNISRFHYDREDGIDVWGRAKSIDDVHRFAQAIRGLATEHLKNLASAVRVYETAGTERDEPIFDYQVSIPFPEEQENAPAETPE